MAMYDAGTCKLASRGGGPEGEMDALLLGKTRELVASTPSQRNWKGILISLLVIASVCGLILFSIYLLRPPDDGPRVKGRKITLADIISSRFSDHTFRGSWISDNELLFWDNFHGLSILNANTLVATPFVANTIFHELNTQIYSISKDRRFILFAHDTQKVFKYSHLAKYTIYDIQNGFPIPLSSSETGDAVQPSLQYATWFSEGSSIIFVYENDIYFKPTPGIAHVVRITSTGVPGVIFNGVPDFIYEEEILNSQSAIWPSPNGQRLLYASFNDSEVGESVFSWYADGKPYAGLKTLRYPKVVAECKHSHFVFNTGTSNPQISLWVAEITMEKVESTQIVLTPSAAPSENYFTGASWFDEETIIVTYMNRRHTVAVLLRCRSPAWRCEEVHTVRFAGPGWLDFLDMPLFSKDGSSFLARLPWRDGEAGLFRHIVCIDVETKKEIPITHGPYEVTQILAWDQLNHYVYFIAAPNGKPGERHLFRISEKPSSSSAIPVPVCLTCPTRISDEEPKDYQKGPEEPTFLYSTLPWTPPGGDQSNRHGGENASSVPVPPPAFLYNNVIFSPNNKFFVRECLGPGVPSVTLHSVPNGRLISVLNNNTLLQEEVASMGMPLTRTFTVALQNGYHAPVRLFLPPGLREEEEFKFPLVLHVDGSPGSQQISEKWGLSWATYLTSQKNYIVAEIDARGTGFQGESVRHSIYKRLGSLEVSDHLEIMQHLKDNYSFIDEENMMVWGRNYGGYLAALILAQDSMKLFRCGIFVSPITRWEFYNTVYAERYMGMPNYSDNYRGYEQSDLTRKDIVEKLADRTFLLIHGTADQTVHFQHTLHFSKELIDKLITFKEQIYPDEDNDLTGIAEHMYNTMEAFIEDCFHFVDFEDWEKANFLGAKM